MPLASQAAVSLGEDSAQVIAHQVDGHHVLGAVLGRALKLGALPGGLPPVRGPLVRAHDRSGVGYRMPRYGCRRRHGCKRPLAFIGGSRAATVPAIVTRCSRCSEGSRADCRFSGRHGWLYPEAGSESSKRRGTTGITGLREPDDEDTGTGRPAPRARTARDRGGAQAT